MPGVERKWSSVLQTDNKKDLIQSKSGKKALKGQVSLGLIACYFII